MVCIWLSASTMIVRISWSEARSLSALKSWTLSLLGKIRWHSSAKRSIENVRFCSTLHSLGLPGSLQAVDTPAGVPASLQQKAAEIRNDAGPSKIRTMMTDVERLGKSNRSILDEVLVAFPETSGTVH